MNGYEDTAERKNDLVHHQHGSTIQSPAKSDHLSYAEKLLKNVTETTQLTKWMQQQSNLEPLSSEILHLAIKLQCPIIILQLLVEQMKADVNYQMNVFERRAAELIYPVEAIIVANKRRRFNQNSNVDDFVVSSLQYLIEKGASKISKSRALHLACAQGRLDCVKALVEDKREDRCDINDVDVNGNTPILASALHSSNTQCIEILLEHGADINYQNHQGNTILHKIVAKPLAKSEYNSIISYLLAKGCNVNTANAQGDTPLIKATRQGNTDIVKLLLDHLTPSQATTKNVKGYTALHEASLWNFVDIVQLLLDKGFDVNSTDQLGNTPLHIVGDQAFVGHNTSNLNYDFNSSLSLDNHTPTNTGAPSSISSFQKRTVELLLKHGADVKAKNTAGDTPLHNMRVSLDKTALLVESGAELEATNQKGETPLLLAVMHGKIQHVEYLLQNGAKIDSIKGNLASLKDEKGNTVAHYAASSIDHLPLLKLLLKEGEFGTSQQINTPNAEGNTLLHVACMNDAKEVIDLLLQSPIDAKAKNNEGKTAFDVALAQFSIQSIVTLHQKGLGGDPQDIIKRRDGDGNSLLHRSVKTCAPEYSRALIRIGINVNVTSDNSHEFADGGTPLHFAAQVDNPEMVEMLLEEGADSNNNANYEGNTPLHVAAKFGNSRALAVLLKQGADATRLNNDEESVMQAAEFGASEDCIQMLQDHGINS